MGTPLITAIDEKRRLNSYTVRMLHHSTVLNGLRLYINHILTFLARKNTYNQVEGLLSPIQNSGKTLYIRRCVA